MTGFSRDSFKAKSVASLKKRKEQEESSGSTANYDRLPFHKLEVGKNVFRIYPARSDEEYWSYPKSTVFLPYMKNDTEWSDKPKPIFNAVTHSTLNFDPVLTYWFMSRDFLSDKFGEKDGLMERNKLGYRKDMDNSCSIKYKDVDVVYADKLVNGEWVFGIFDLGYYVKQGLDDIAEETLDEGKAVFSVEPFTDPDKGIPFVVEYSKTGKTAAENFKVSLRKEMKKTKLEDGQVVEVAVNKPQPLSDEQIEFWLKQPSLKEKYVNSYKKKDFETQVAALRKIDIKLGFGLFESDEFQAKLDNFANMLEDYLEEYQSDKPKKEVDSDDLPF